MKTEKRYHAIRNSEGQNIVNDSAMNVVEGDRINSMGKSLQQEYQNIIHVDSPKPGAEYIVYEVTFRKLKTIRYKESFQEVVEKKKK